MYNSLTLPKNMVRWLIAVAVATAVVVTGLGVTQPAMAAIQRVEGATFQWGVNDESTGRAPFGHNLLIAGEVPNINEGSTRGARTLSNEEFEQYFSGQEGNVSITGPDGEVNTVKNRYRPGSRVNIANGTGHVDPETNSGRIEWDGSFTVMFYSGMVYFTIHDPVLTLKDGHGAVTADMTGYGSAIDDFSKWEILERAEDVDIATFHNVSVDLSEDGVSVTPDYQGVAVGNVATPQKREGQNWGSFPQEFIDFVEATGLGAYWYSSGGAADPKKLPQAISVSYTLSELEDDALFAVPSLQVKDVTDTSAVVSWSEAYGATGYQAQYRASGEEDWTDLVDESDQSAKITGLEPKTQYVVRVCSVAGGNFTDWKTRTFTTEAKNYGVTHRITSADAIDGLGLEISQPGLTLEDLPAPTGRRKIAMMMGIFDQPVSATPLATSDALSYGMQTPNGQEHSSTLTVPADKLNPAGEYWVAAWTGVGHLTPDTAIYQAKIELTDEQRTALFEGQIEERSSAPENLQVDRVFDVRASISFGKEEPRGALVEIKKADEPDSAYREASSLSGWGPFTVTLDNLTPQTSYVVRVRYDDLDENNALGDPAFVEFTTNAPREALPKVANPRAESVDATSADIRWDELEREDVQVMISYGRSGQTARRVVDAEVGASHYTLSRLEPDREYTASIYVRSVEDKRFTGEATDITFRTASESEPDVSESAQSESETPEDVETDDAESNEPTESAPAATTSPSVDVAEPSTSQPPTDTATEESPSQNGTPDGATDGADDHQHLTLTVDPAQGTAGDTVTVGGMESLAGQQVDVWFHSEPVHVADGAPITEQGTVQVTVPGQAAVGDHEFVVFPAGQAGDELGRVAFTVVAPKTASASQQPGGSEIAAASTPDHTQSVDQARGSAEASDEHEASVGSSLAKTGATVRGMILLAGALVGCGWLLRRRHPHQH
ncbi:hypothetical protein DCC27_006865 [Auritidibacter sp. NML130574]|uniref:fibronectin type III domain-containing protein n=1 Tax=Auritidibacter sp. NML130574 TaxID=2170745 RepID=UPI000D73F290|nr:fibronectin type III domain-containing protein [Auritidibacter sp. NML130574]AXR74066.1 hypothetical protein DCC27_006865 [Auritidibacter sp. NML130574]